MSFVGIKKAFQKHPRNRTHEEGGGEYGSGPFKNLIIAYIACNISVEGVEKLASARTEAQALRTTIDGILEEIDKRREEDRLWSYHNGWALSATVDQKCEERMRRQVRRLRALALDDIDPLLTNPSLIGKAWSSLYAETKAERIDRVLREAYDAFIRAFEEMRKCQRDERAAIEQGQFSQDAPEKGCQVS